MRFFRLAEEWSDHVSGNFASLTGGLLVGKGSTKPSPVMAPETSPFALARKGEAEPSLVMPAKAFPLRCMLSRLRWTRLFRRGERPDGRQRESRRMRRAVRQSRGADRTLRIN